MWTTWHQVHAFNMSVAAKMSKFNEVQFAIARREIELAVVKTQFNCPDYTLMLLWNTLHLVCLCYWIYLFLLVILFVFFGLTWEQTYSLYYIIFEYNVNVSLMARCMLNFDTQQGLRLAIGTFFLNRCHWAISFFMIRSSVVVLWGNMLISIYLPTLTEY